MGIVVDGRCRERVCVSVFVYQGWWLCSSSEIAFTADTRQQHETTRRELFTNPRKKIREEKNIEREEDYLGGMCCCCCGEDCECRPLAFLLGLPFAFLSLLLSLIGAFIWIVGLALTCICPCCLCATVMVELALGLINAPILVIKWFTEQIPC